MVIKQKPYFWAGLIARLAVLPFLLEWFHPDERQLLEFARFQAHSRLHPFMESALHLRNQTFPWIAGQAFKILDVLHFPGPWPELVLIHGVIGLTSWLTLDALARSSRRPEVLGWFFALFWAFPFLYSRGLLEAISLPPTILLYLTIKKRHYLRAGFWGGCVAVLRYPSALWIIGGALLAWRIESQLGDRRSQFQRWIRAVGLALVGLLIALSLGGLADLKTYGQFLGSAPAYWTFNHPHGPVEKIFGNDSLYVYLRWFEYLFTPWLAPLVVLAAAYALGISRGVLYFVLPYLIGHFWTPHREPRFMLPLTPFLALAVVDAWSEGGFAAITQYWDRLSNRGRKIWTAMGVAHLAINFIWYPLNVWAQWSSGQGQMIRAYSEVEMQPSLFLNFSDPIMIDAFIPPSSTWADRRCQLHRPISGLELQKRIWILAPEKLNDCETYGVNESARFPPGWSRLFRVHPALLSACPTSELAKLCPHGLIPAPKGEPQVTDHL